MMWNDLDTGACEGMIAETISLRGHGGDTIRAYYSRPLYADSCPSIVLIPHMPGWDEYCREAARRFTQHNYAVLCPDIYARFGTGKPAEVAMKAREAGGAKDETVMGDVLACIDFLKEQPFETHRQKVIGRFIVDFCICKPKIVIEIDGFQHGEDELRRKDEIRDAELEALGYTVLRYSNQSIKKHFKDVCQDIWMSVYPDGREDENI